MFLRNVRWLSMGYGAPYPEKYKYFQSHIFEITYVKQFNYNVYFHPAPCILYENPFPFIKLLSVSLSLSLFRFLETLGQLMNLHKNWYESCATETLSIFVSLNTLTLTALICGNIRVGIETGFVMSQKNIKCSYFRIV